MLRGVDHGAHRVVAHRRYAVGDPQAPRQRRGGGAEGLAGVEPARALEMGREVGVAEPEPGFAAERFKRRHDAAAVVRQAPAGLRVGAPRQGVGHGVEVRRDAEAEMAEIVAGVHDDEQVFGVQDPRQTAREARPADPSRKGEDHAPHLGENPRPVIPVRRFSFCPAAARRRVRGYPAKALAATRRTGSGRPRGRDGACRRGGAVRCNETADGSHMQVIGLPRQSTRDTLKRRRRARKSGLDARSAAAAVGVTLSPLHQNSQVRLPCCVARDDRYSRRISGA